MSWEQVLLSLVLLVPALLIVAFTVYDIVRATHLTTVRKVLWLAVVVVVPVLGTLFYLMARPFPDPASAVTGRVGEFLDLLDRRERGTLSDAEFAQARARLFGQ